MRGTTDSDLWKCKRCGLPLSSCRCSGYPRRTKAAVMALALALLMTQGAQAQCGCESTPEPIIGTPCNSDAPHTCYDYQVYLSVIKVQ